MDKPMPAHQMEPDNLDKFEITASKVEMNIKTLDAPEERNLQDLLNCKSRNDRDPPPLPSPSSFVIRIEHKTGGSRWPFFASQTQELQGPSLFSFARMNPSILLLLVSLIWQQVLASNGSWIIDWFCIGEGLYGKNLSFQIGLNMCELPASNSPINVTCFDNFKAFLVSDNCTALLSEKSTKMVQLEVISEVPILPNHSEICETPEEPKMCLNPEKPLNPTDEPSPGHKDGPATNLFLSIGLPIIIIIIIAATIIVIYYYWAKKKNQSNERSSQKDITEMTTFNLHSGIQMNKETQNSSNGHDIQNGETSQFLAV
ncbi:uncharacterized protein [Pyxicephalus adspersus]|uniref:uncharacterized protein n=1 Tax=Pyxicephalus adspersus TaxID=30357 RepID=UPI003B5AB19C